MQTINKLIYELTPKSNIKTDFLDNEVTLINKYLKSKSAKKIPAGNKNYIHNNILKTNHYQI